MEQERCYACLDLLFLASLEERRAYKRDCCGTSFHHNCARPEYLQSKCGSCTDEHRKTVPVPDLVLIDEESSELVLSKDLCVICMDPESTRNKLLVTRCCKRFAPIYSLRIHYRITEMCYSEEIATKLSTKLPV